MTKVAASPPIIPLAQRPYLSVDDAALYAAISAKTIRRLIESGRLTSYRPSRGRVVVSREELDAHIRSSTSRPRSGRGRHTRPAAGA